MYFVARKVSLPNVEVMLKEEKRSENGSEMYLKFSQDLNQLINLYFSITDESKSLLASFLLPNPGCSKLPVYVAHLSIKSSGSRCRPNSALVITIVL